MLVKTVFIEKGNAELRYCCTICLKVVALRSVFEGRCHHLRYCCTKKSEIATLRGESRNVPGRLLQKVSLVDVNQEQSDY